MMMLIAVLSVVGYFILFSIIWYQDKEKNTDWDEIWHVY